MDFGIKEYIIDTYRLFYPRLCGACNTTLLKGENHICFICRNNLPYTDFEKIANNPVEKIFEGRIDIEFATALLYFSKGEKTQHLLHHIKYNDRKQLAIFLGNLFGERLKQKHQEIQFDAIMPIPLHQKKQQLRGYNQSTYIAKGIAAILEIPIIENVVIRKHNTTTQTRKNRIERWENIASAFSLKPNCNLENKHILIVDDVLTTGATLEACAQTLKSKQNLKISIATIAIAF